MSERNPLRQIAASVLPIARGRLSAVNTRIDFACSCLYSIDFQNEERLVTFFLFRLRGISSIA